jgi:hypothetical protein
MNSIKRIGRCGPTENHRICQELERRLLMQDNIREPMNENSQPIGKTERNHLSQHVC